ncbi:MAG: dipeptidase [candidate division KSB1 bacterium]|nr:dipeptidase [candidate division KSB1 bacterium]MDZ7275552.1 dipeptidase [candidate division KSB1 bacterium]MDZ7286136.1 dipeptidase [candidate division KSB1 bacterium]MDZ7296362.1 dipeptidase [candidate division KSB1 bacterium]MDZ7307138.1 dipeptidase [candidate division KSB1 bacterium]
MNKFEMLLGLCLCFSVVSVHAADETKVRQRARRLAQKFIIVDTHVDVPYRLREKYEDISGRTQGGNFDYMRARQGGLNAAFMSIYIPSPYEAKGLATALADSLIDMVEGFERRWPDKFAIARSVAEVRAHFKKGLLALPMGMENGAPIAGKLENLRHFWSRGIRYITLTHAKSNHICDSSYDPNRPWQGLSPFGREVVAEMNRLGIMIDISHVSDSTFYQVLRLTRAPVIASHSSCRHFTPGWERNMDDDMIRALARNGGVIQIAFGSSFVNGAYQKAEEGLWRFIEEHKIDPGSEEGRARIRQYREQNPRPPVTIADIVANIDHVVKLVGVDHVGFGSDFDGVGDSLPEGMTSVADYPNLIFELLRLGYSEKDIAKICSGNLLRVWSEVEKTAQRLQAGTF